jgi:hypothetical protein
VLRVQATTAEALRRRVESSFADASRSGKVVARVRIVLAASQARNQAGHERFLAALLRSVREQAVEEYEVVLVVEARSHSAEGASFFDLLDRLMPALDRRGTLRLRFAPEAARACA